MTCGVVDEGGVEVSGANGVDDVDCGNIISCVDRPPTRLRPRPTPLPQTWIGCILTTADGIGCLMDSPYDVDVSSSCAEMRCSSPIRRKTYLTI